MRRTFEKPHDLKSNENWTFFDLSNYQKETQSITDFGKKWKNKFPYIVVVGLGGAILGTQAIVEALLPFSKNPKINFLRNLDPTLLEKIFSWIDFKKTLFIVVSKSGETLETITLFDILVQKMYTNNLEPRERMILIAEEKPSTLFQKAKKIKLPFYPHPKQIGGRFSVLTSVSMLPSFLFGLKIEDFLEGAHIAKKNIQEAWKLAQIAYDVWRKGKAMMVLFPYSVRLLRLCDWYTQLIAESLGKNGKGITPLTAIGPKDQHSLLQLFLDGPKDKWFFFLSHTHEKDYQKIAKIIEAEKKGVMKMFETKRFPFMELSFHELTEKSLGSLFFFLEYQTALLGKMFKVNPFNQPAVEKTKQITKHLLRP